MTPDPDIERAAMRLAFHCDAPAALFPRIDLLTDGDRLQWWTRQTAAYRLTYRLRASVCIEAFEQAEVRDVAAE